MTASTSTVPSICMMLRPGREIVKKIEAEASTQGNHGGDCPYGPFYRRGRPLCLPSQFHRNGGLKSPPPVIRRFAGDGDIVRMAFLQ